MDNMLTGVADFISKVGFPIFVALYVLMRLEPAISSLKKTINVLTYVLAKSMNVDIEEARTIAGTCK